MAETPGNFDISTRVKYVRVELSEWECDVPIDYVIRGKPPEEIMRLVMDEKERVEQRLKIIGRNFPKVHQDAVNFFNLTKELLVESSPNNRFKMYQERDSIFQAYEIDAKIVLKPIFMIALQDIMDYEAISWNSR